ncbi:MAG: single-stranded-DNA-specific exonuclease RecJ [Bdellovibrionaceae bacterium]|nr:single-stranded-DNA-specific exonuclease RecJ [Pseudobdellovibrionaceae bacterium]
MSVGAVPPGSLLELLQNRGYSGSDAIQNLLYPKLSDLKDPFLLKDLSLAVDRLERAFAAKEKICIYADFDLDGTSGLALMWTGLRQLGFETVLRYQPKRLSEGYGFHREAVEELHRQGVTLIVTVDVGITAHAACERAKEIGMDVVLTDHHLPSETLPPAYAVVNPNQGDDSSGLGYLCGAGVAFTLLRGLKKRFHEKGIAEALDLKALLDYFTIATLTDMVPLIDDNRVLVKHGLVVLAETQRPGLRALLDALELSGRPLTSQDVAIRFAPKLNALSRMENGVLPIDILLCEDRATARELMKVVLENNSTRVQLQADAEQKAMELLKDWTEQDFVFVASEHFHRGIVGLIATKLAQNFNRPAFVGSLDPQEGIIVGSARLPQGSDGCLVEALGAGASVLARFGGHSAAAGFEVHLPKVEALNSSLKGHFESLRRQPRPLEIKYDLEMSLRGLDATFMKWHDFMGPYGVGFEIPLFRFKDVQLRGVRTLKGGHLKLQISDLSGRSSVDALLFSPAARQVELVGGASAGSFEILGELQWNYYNGQKTMQILVRDLKVQAWQ